MKGREMKMLSVFFIIALSFAGICSASEFDLGISGGTYAWGNATEVRFLHEEQAVGGQGDIALFAEYGGMISGRIELRYDCDYFANSTKGSFSDPYFHDEWQYGYSYYTEDFMLPILLKANMPFRKHFKFNFFAGPELCLYRASTGYYWNDTSQTWTTPTAVTIVDATGHTFYQVTPWEPQSSIGALAGIGIDYDFEKIRVGIKTNVEFVRLSTGDDEQGWAVWHRYNVQLDFGYELFGDKR
jgi:hypothetical protein